MTHSNLNYQPTARRRADLSRHACKRAQQRGIREGAVPLVLAYGQPEFDGRGAVRYLMTARSIESLRRAVGSTQQVEALAGVYAIVSVSDSTVITIGHRHS